MEGRERRKNTRVAFQTVADVKIGGRQYDQCQTHDLSLKGVSIMGITGHPVGTGCEIALMLSGSTSVLRLEMKGEVVRVEEQSVALHFTEVDLDSFYHLKNIIYYNSEDPDELENELATS